MLVTHDYSPHARPLAHRLLGETKGTKSMDNRDDFTRSVRISLAFRAGNQCSFPGCSRITSGPSDKSAGAVNFTGKAAHIHAASPNGPRALATMTREQRRDISNGIWLCSDHATLIDNDEAKYPPEKLRDMKLDHELKIGSLQAYGSSLHNVNRGNDLIVFECVRRALDPGLVLVQSISRHPNPEDIGADHSVYVSHKFIYKMYYFVESASELLNAYTASIETRSELNVMIQVCKDFLELIDEADEIPLGPLAHQVCSASLRGDFMYVVDTSRAAAMNLSNADQISYQIVTFKTVMLSLPMAYNRLIHAINGQNIYPHPIPYLCSDRFYLVPPRDTAYLGLAAIRRQILDRIRRDGPSTQEDNSIETAY